MPDLINPDLFSHATELPEGSAALVFSKDGSVSIQHNIASIRETGLMKGEAMAPLILCLAALEMSGDPDAMQKAFQRAMRKLSTLEAPSPNDTVN